MGIINIFIQAESDPFHPLPKGSLAKALQLNHPSAQQAPKDPVRQNGAKRNDELIIYFFRFGFYF